VSTHVGWEEGDPIVGLLITFVILKVTWDAWRTVHARQEAGPSWAGRRVPHRLGHLPCLWLYIVAPAVGPMHGASGAGRLT
jgi:hypothetical protein